MRGLLLTLALTGCADAEKGDTAEVDPFCVDAPVTTWDNFGAGFVQRECQTCHSLTSSNRNGAPTEVNFDDAQSVWDWSERVMARAIEGETMPPQGGVHEDDRARLEIWLRCAEEGS